MMNSSLENTLKETWEMKEKFYEDTIGLTMIEILERIEGKKFKVKKEVLLETTVEIDMTKPVGGNWHKGPNMVSYKSRGIK